MNFLAIFLGIAAGIGIWLAIYFGSESDNILLQYLFVIIFAVIIFGQRKIERTLDMRLTLFTKFWLIGLDYRTWLVHSRRRPYRQNV